MAIARQPYPVEVRRQVDGEFMEVVWNDGHTSRYAWSYLRGWCPCAQCQGHSGTRRFVSTPTAQLERVALVGRYALNLRWRDGHETGIYTYAYLRELCPCCHAQEPHRAS
ncbi:MAG: DUF971 domain-containing protein [Candidatus Binatia bacterium]|nr:DUF971 domain-containing protein [Candidatus Binatia bacterium]